MRTTLILVIAIWSALPAFGAIRGTVMTVAGAPISGARIEALPLESSTARDERISGPNPSRTAIASATTDASGNFSLDAKTGAVDLVVSAAFANPGPSLKRIRPAPMGRAYRVVHRTTHLTVQVSEKEED